MRSVTSGVTRGQFLRGDFSGSRSVVRPPWSGDELAFVEACSRCSDCVGVCPEKILEKGRGGFPQVNFSRGECTFCGDCVRVCKSGALSHGVPQAPWALKARVAPSCLALNQVVCRTCGESCPEGAIRFKISIGAVAKPEIDLAACTGCGACFGPCPISAVTIGEVVAEVVA